MSSKKALAPHCSTLAWKIPWTEEPGALQSDMTEWLHIHFSLSCIEEGNGNPLQYSCLENPKDGGAWWAAVSGVAQSRTRLKRLSSSSSFRKRTRCPKTSTAECLKRRLSRLHLPAAAWGTAVGVPAGGSKESYCQKLLTYILISEHISKNPCKSAFNFTSPLISDFPKCSHLF